MCTNYVYTAIFLHIFQMDGLDENSTTISYDDAEVGDADAESDSEVSDDAPENSDSSADNPEDDEEGDLITSLDPNDYSRQQLVDISRSQDLGDKVIVSWREKPTTRGGPTQNMVGVYPGAWCTIDMNTDEGWTFHWPPKNTTVPGVKKLVRDNAIPNANWRHNKLTGIYASGDHQAMAELLKDLESTIPDQPTSTTSSVSRNRIRKRTKHFGSDTDKQSSSGWDTESRTWKEDSKKLMAKGYAKIVTERANASKRKKHNMSESDDEGSDGQDSNAYSTMAEPGAIVEGALLSGSTCMDDDMVEGNDQSISGTSISSPDNLLGSSHQKVMNK